MKQPGTLLIAGRRIGLDHALPMGLYKQSGIGVSGGFQGVEEYLETKSVTVALR